MANAVELLYASLIVFYDSMTIEATGIVFDNTWKDKTAFSISSGSALVFASVTFGL